MPDTPRIGFFVNRDHLKDLSFENPIGPIPVEEAQALRIGVTGTVVGRPQDEAGEFIVEATLTITGRDDERVRFICELTYAADVTLSHIPEPVQDQTLCVDVPNYLLPRINEVIDHAGRAGGLPSLRVAKIDFLALFQQARAGRAAAAGSSGS